MVNTFDFATSQEAWEGLNEYFLLKSKEILENGGTRAGNMLIAYEVFVQVRLGWVDPNFDFGNMFGYRTQKWTGLISNYVNLNYLDILKSQVVEKEKKTYSVYNISMPFDNSHGHGKNCLLSLTLSRRPNLDIPILTFHLRSSEITKRLLVDFLLVQRIAEYIYGEEQRVMINLYVINMYQNIEAFTMYHNHRSIPKLCKKAKLNNDPWSDKVIETLDKFSTVKPESISYKSFRRAANQLQGVHGDRPMLAGELYLVKKDIDYPEDCITVKQRRAYKKLQNKK